MSATLLRVALFDPGGNPLVGAETQIQVLPGITWVQSNLVDSIPKPTPTDPTGVVWYTLYPNAELTPADSSYELIVYYKGVKNTLSFVLPDSPPPNVDPQRGVYWDLTADGIIVASPSYPAGFVVGPTGPPGPPGTGSFASFVQLSASTSWNIFHTLNRMPLNISVFDTDGNEIIGFGIQFNSVNQVILSFASPVSGTAYLS